MMKHLSDYLIFEQAKKSLGSVLTNHLLYKSFKIGKTTQSLEERFSQNYIETYESIELLYDGGTNGKLIDELEIEMIKYCLEIYPDKCDNEQQGGGPTCEDNADKNHTAKLYVVWK